MKKLALVLLVCVVQHATGAIQQTGPGVLIRVTPDKGQSGVCAQYQAGTRTTIRGLNRPTSVEVGPGTQFT